ncbi:Uma2 family endonuclease [Spirosoma koreense]
MLATSTQPEALPTHLQTVEEFEQWERQHISEDNYEFIRGHIIPKPSMKQEEYFIVKFLTRLFITTAAFQNGDELTPEMDSYIDGMRRRRPDLTYFTSDQIRETRAGIRQKTQFAIEILSDSESYLDVLDKLEDYFDGGAQLVWYIVPKRQRIIAYTSPETLKIYKDSAVITAAPVVPDMQFRISEMFE